MESIRAMTWNVWWRFGENWKQRERGLVEVVRDQRPDVLGVQECWGDAETTQADLLAGALHAHSAFTEVGLPPVPSPQNDSPHEGIVMGLGLVSRWPIVRTEKVPMPSFGRVNAALLASVDHPLGELRIVVGATSWEPERMAETTAQVAELRALTRDPRRSRPLPSILLADLNYDRTQPPLAGMDLEDAWDAADVDADPRTLSATNRFAPREAASQFDRRIDHILYTPGSWAPGRPMRGSSATNPARASAVGPLSPPRGHPRRRSAGLKRRSSVS